ncbi:hypothetical protein AB0I84_32005 [Streptomyces spectabilis]|uniref:hypothetical protein n=1 Tax=Streptomyces spectabilis TaxID=68270 RepID=UPI00340D73C4
MRIARTLGAISAAGMLASALMLTVGSTTANAAYCNGPANGISLGVDVNAERKPKPPEPAHDVYTVVVCNYLPVDIPQIFPDQGVS